MVLATKLEDGTKLLKLRNPWGRGEWKGDWSDNSSKWTEDLKKRFNVEDKDDGSFFMTFEDMIKNFVGVSICHYHDDYFRSSLMDFNPYNSPALYEFSIITPGEYYFGLSQTDKKLYGEDFEYSFIGITIIRIDSEENPIYIGGEATCKRDPWFMHNCSQGNYIAIVNTNWKYDCHKFSVNIYGPKNVKIHPIVEEENRKKAMEFHRLSYKEYVCFSYYNLIRL